MAVEGALRRLSQRAACMMSPYVHCALCLHCSSHSAASMSLGDKGAVTVSSPCPTVPTVGALPHIVPTSRANTCPYPTALTARLTSNVHVKLDSEPRSYRVHEHAGLHALDLVLTEAACRAS